MSAIVSSIRYIILHTVGFLKSNGLTVGKIIRMVTRVSLIWKLKNICPPMCRFTFKQFC